MNLFLSFFLTELLPLTLRYCPVSWQRHVLGVFPSHSLHRRVQSEALSDAHGGVVEMGQILPSQEVSACAYRKGHRKLNASFSLWNGKWSWHCVCVLSDHSISSPSRPCIRSITSCLHFSWWSAWRAKLYSVQQIALAVVSWPVDIKWSGEFEISVIWTFFFYCLTLPANMKVLASACISSSVRPCPSSSCSNTQSNVHCTHLYFSFFTLLTSSVLPLTAGWCPQSLSFSVVSWWSLLLSPPAGWWGHDASEPPPWWTCKHHM